MKKIFTLFAAMLLALTVSASTDFSTPYKCAAADASLSGTAEAAKFYKSPSADPVEIVFSDISKDYTAIAEWTVTTSKGCYITVSLEMGTFIGSSNKHIFDVKIFDDNDVELGHLTQGSDHTGANTTEDLDGTILLPQAGDYKVQLIHNRDWCKGAVKNVVLTYYADAPTAIIPVDAVVLDHEVLTLDVNETFYLHATVSPDNATYPTVTWTTSDDTKVTVENGTIKGIAAGTATITATAGEKSKTCEVTVSDAIPSTDFASPYFLKGTKAELASNIYVSEADSLHYEDKSVCGTATWKINVTAPCFINATANFKTGSKSGSKLRIVILDREDAQVGDSLMQDYYNKDGDKDFTGSIALPKAGIYTVKLVNIQGWSSAKLRGITLTKDASKDVVFKGAWDSWTLHPATSIAADGSCASVSINLGVFDNKEFGLTLGNNFRANGYGYHRGYTGCAGITGNDGNMKLTTDYVGEYTFKWFYANDSMAIEFPEKKLEDGFYLVGTFGGVDEWNIEDLDASKLFVWNTKVDDKDEYKLTLNLAEGDAFKVHAVSKGAFGYIYPDPGSNYVVNGALAGNVTIYFRPEGNGGDDWHYHVIYCVRNGDPTAIDNTVVGEKAVKLMENGQIVIIKNGVRYNVLGTVIK